MFLVSDFILVIGDEHSLLLGTHFLLLCVCFEVFMHSSDSTAENAASREINSNIVSLLCCCRTELVAGN